MHFSIYGKPSAVPHYSFNFLNNENSRDRNREHARYTRLRKKAYIGKLKDLLEEIKLCSDSEDCERRVIAESISKLVCICSTSLLIHLLNLYLFVTAKFATESLNSFPRLIRSELPRSNAMDVTSG